MTPHRYRIFIRAPRDRVWQGITDPDFTRQYFHRTAFESTLEPGTGYRYVMDGDTDAVVGEVEVADAPERLVVTWRVMYDPAASAEPPSRVEWLLTDVGNGTTQLDVVHGDLARSPVTWNSVRHGWVWILDGLKSLLETGEALPPPVETTAPGTDGAVHEAPAEWHRIQAVDANNAIWPLLESTERTADDDEALLEHAYAAAYHWARAAGRGPENDVRAAYMIAKAHLAVGDADVALRAARRCLDGCRAHGLGDFDLAYAHEVMARALHTTGDTDAAGAHWDLALAVPVADPDDRAQLDADLAGGVVAR